MRDPLMRKIVPALTSFLIVGSLYGAPIFLAFYGLVIPSFQVEAPRAPRMVVFDLSSMMEDGSLDEQGTDDVTEEERAAKPIAHTGTGGKGLVVPTSITAQPTPNAGTGPTTLAKVNPTLTETTKKVRKKKKRRRKRRKCLEGTDDINPIGPNRYSVERDLVDYYARDLDELARLAWVSWHENEAGKVDGFLVRRVRCGSVLHEAGLRNGDVVHAVNGRQIRSLARAIPLWWQLRRRPIVHVRITRGDESMRLWYRLT